MQLEEKSRAVMKSTLANNQVLLLLLLILCYKKKLHFKLTSPISSMPIKELLNRH